MGFPSGCCEYVLLPLVNKEAALGLLKCRIGQGGNSKQIEKEKRQSQRAGVYQILAEPCSRPRPHGDAQINRDGLT